MGRPKGSKNKPKVSQETIQTLTTELDNLSNRITEESVGIGFIPDVAVRVSTVDTKSNPDHSYYQFIHPCNLENKNYDYRFLGIIKDGKNYSSLPFANREECHTLLKKLIEETDIPNDPMLIIN